jgi:hypothetical protein
MLCPNTGRRPREGGGGGEEEDEGGRGGGGNLYALLFRYAK